MTADAIAQRALVVAAAGTVTRIEAAPATKNPEPQGRKTSQRSERAAKPEKPNEPPHDTALTTAPPELSVSTVMTAARKLFCATCTAT